MKKWKCSICGEIVEGETAPERCPLCKAPAEKFEEITDADMGWATEHEVGITDGVPMEIIEGLRANFNGECSEVGMYLAMSRVAFREGYQRGKAGDGFAGRACAGRPVAFEGRRYFVLLRSPDQRRADRGVLFSR